jgi:hypothetical protein
METDLHKTDVIFRIDVTKDWHGTVFALFPHNVADHKGNVLTYQHVGQHSSGEYSHCLKTSRPAAESEYKDLKKELESIGYNINVVHKQTRKKYLESYYEARK